MAQENNLFTVSRHDLVASIESALSDYFFDGVSPTLGQYAVDHIIGDIVLRVQALRSEALNVTNQPPSLAELWCALTCGKLASQQAPDELGRLEVLVGGLNEGRDSPHRGVQNLSGAM